MSYIEPGRYVVVGVESNGETARRVLADMGDKIRVESVLRWLNRPNRLHP